MSDQPPQSFDRQLSSQEERDVLLNFMGSTYGEIKKLDGNIVGESSTLQATKSEEVKRQIEKVYNETQPQQPQVQVQQPQVQVQQPQVQVQQPQVQVQQPQVQVQQLDDNQLSFNFDVNEKDELFELVNKVLTKLDKLNRKVDVLTDLVQQPQLVKKKSVNRKKAVKANKEL
jgi:outer membrane protein OmpA-like peptidoglycan-associated protein